MSIVLYLRGKATYLLLSPSIFFFLPLSSTHARMRFIYELNAIGVSTVSRWSISHSWLIHQPFLTGLQVASWWQKRRNWKKTSPPHFFSRIPFVYRGFREWGVSQTGHSTPPSTPPFFSSLFFYFRSEKSSFIIGKNLEVWNIFCTFAYES